MINKCNSCFYALMDKEAEAPCAACTGYSNYIPGTVYYTGDNSSKPLKEAIDDWFKEGKDQVQEDFWSTPDPQYNVVNKPKHYMLFDADYINSTAYLKEGIEVRDVIEKLVEKISDAVKEDDYPQFCAKPMFAPDYVQMMQYLMRFMDKNGVEDLKKARWYLDKLIDAYESDV